MPRVAFATTSSVILSSCVCPQPGEHPDRWLDEDCGAACAAIAGSRRLGERKSTMWITSWSMPCSSRRCMRWSCSASGRRPKALRSGVVRLAERIERHGLSCQVDLDGRGALGPESCGIARERRHAYACGSSSFRTLHTHATSSTWPIDRTRRDARARGGDFGLAGGR